MNDSMKEQSNHTKEKVVSYSQINSLITAAMEIYEDSIICPFCENLLKGLIIRNDGDDMESRMCPVCKRRFVNKHQYSVIRKYCGSSNKIPELYIMDFPEL